MNFDQIPSPCYVLDEQALTANLQRIASVSREADVDIIPALKGFAMWGVFPLVRPYVGGVAASSEHEARLAYEEMGTPAHTYSPAYTDRNFAGILQYSNHITFNSIAQYARFREGVHHCGHAVSIGLRINPEFSAVDTNLYNPCMPGSRLGITAAQIGNSLPADVEGLHVHALCESPADVTAALIDATEARFGHLFSGIKWINFGGGHLMTREGYDVACLVGRLRAFRKKYPDIHVILEPGAAFVWDAGVLVATVEDIVESGDTRTAVLDVSFAAHMPDCLEMPYKPRIRGASDERRDRTEWSIGGNSCLAGDVVGSWSFDDEPTVGKRIVFEDMIHYTMVKTTTFNGVPHPSIGTWNGTDFKLLRTFGYEDYKNRLS